MFYSDIATAIAIYIGIALNSISFSIRYYIYGYRVATCVYYRYDLAIVYHNVHTVCIAIHSSPHVATYIAT